MCLSTLNKVFSVILYCKSVLFVLEHVFLVFLFLCHLLGFTAVLLVSLSVFLPVCGFPVSLSFIEFYCHSAGQFICVFLSLCLSVSFCFTFTSFACPCVSLSVSFCLSVCLSLSVSRLPALHVRASVCLRKFN